MKLSRDEKERLDRLLREAYKAKNELNVDQHWRAKVMSRIQQESTISSQPAFITAFQQFVWKLAPATLAASVVLLVLLSRLYVTTEYNGLQLFANYIETLAFKQIFWI